MDIHTLLNAQRTKDEIPRETRTYLEASDKTQLSGRRHNCADVTPDADVKTQERSQASDRSSQLKELEKEPTKPKASGREAAIR